MSIGSVIGKYAIKAAGVAGVGLLGYDAHKRGKLHAQINKNKKDFEALDYYWDNSRNVPTASAVNSSLKDKLFKWELDNNFRGFVNRGTGYLKGFASMVTDDIVPWGLSTAAILTKGTAAKVSGIALGAYTAYAFLKNICGFGLSDKK